jgi:heme a synthase
MNLVKWWLFAGIVLIFFQIVIGGITRLTGSGLSITKWEIVTGTVPPLSDKDWEEEFEAYKQTPQYEKINEGMSVSEFKFIYFWEYFHRLWARIMGFVFLLPFIFFVYKGHLRGRLLKQTVILFVLAALVASFGWIMVASGLINRPWVNAYKLTVHLSLAIVTFLYLWHIYFGVREVKPIRLPDIFRGSFLVLFIAICFQIILGGILSGSRAAMVYPSWPGMDGSFVPDVLIDRAEWNISNFVYYDKNSFFPALVQFAHRTLAYLIIIGMFFWLFSVNKLLSIDSTWGIIKVVLSVTVIVQLILGILTLLNSVGSIPLWLGVMHQAVGIILITAAFYVLYKLYYAKVDQSTSL